MTRHHREHVEGDYKDPPPTGKYDIKRRRSMEILKQLLPNAKRFAVIVNSGDPVSGELRKRLEYAAASLGASEFGPGSAGQVQRQATADSPPRQRSRAEPPDRPAARRRRDSEGAQADPRHDQV